jgi:2,4-dienoyl-CoA reductase-like NADH-dependent reductase (Old Yellow Enzyme family)
MCQYSSTDGLASDWHLVHLGTRAIGGAALVFTEATAVTADGRISPNDLGIWSDAHVEGLSRVTHFVRGQGSVCGIQLAHAGFKGSTRRPWEGEGTVPLSEGGWQPVGPGSEPFTAGYPVPRPLEPADIQGIVKAFAAAANRALLAGFQVAEIHAAHGYLIHQFLSPLINHRTDAYGGSFDNRVRLCLEIVDAVRRVWPESLPVVVRISATDWVSDGWDPDQSVALATLLRRRGVDLIDCSSGGAVPKAAVPVAPGYQVPFAARIRREAGIATGAVGMITTAAQADEIIQSEQADCVLFARQMLRDPYFPLHAAQELGVEIGWPAQYLRAAPRGTRPREASERAATGER